ncbi:MAG: hypothetical protein L6R37_001718 [Teloschistes peruensis]|nr:MAG: hypothetical protein L6R37_001718 [Teloschistes peruensis]
MADVRSMLRSERANRRITHPHLSYSTTGTLICLICDTQVKSETLWNKHLASSKHAKNLQNVPKKHKPLTASPKARDTTNGSKKRKANDDSSDEDTRKRTRGEQSLDQEDSRIVESPSQGNSAKTNGRPMAELKRKRSTVEPEESQRALPGKNNVTLNQENIPTYPLPSNDASTSQIQPNPTAQVDEDEWAAFQRDVASLPPETSALTAAADISAAPLTAAELAAQSREQASTQAKERRDAEIEGEKEDAARQMEEEFEEMAELEDRVRRLREKREELRRREVEGEKGGGDVAESEAPLKGIPRDEDPGTDGEGESDSGDEIDEWGGWGR